MIRAFDTYYFDDKAKTICVSFDNWADTEPSAVYTGVLEGVEDYTPGEFYKRELPCILSLLQKIDTRQVEAIIVDGYVFLDDEAKPGLGSRLYTALNAEIPVIGVAKTNFKTLNKHKFPLRRGTSGDPIFISAVGTDPVSATEKIRTMAGPHRIPTLLKYLDTLTKSA